MSDSKCSAKSVLARAARALGPATHANSSNLDTSPALAEVVLVHDCSPRHPASTNQQPWPRKFTRLQTCWRTVFDMVHASVCDARVRAICDIGVPRAHDISTGHLECIERDGLYGNHAYSNTLDPNLFFEIPATTNHNCCLRLEETPTRTSTLQSRWKIFDSLDFLTMEVQCHSSTGTLDHGACFRTQPLEFSAQHIARLALAKRTSHHANALTTRLDTPVSHSEANISPGASTARPTRSRVVLSSRLVCTYIYMATECELAPLMSQISNVHPATLS